MQWPRKEGEDVIDLTGKVSEAAHITKYDQKQNDVAHRNSSKPAAPIINVFERKHDRNNFY